MMVIPGSSDEQRGILDEQRSKTYAKTAVIPCLSAAHDTLVVLRKVGELLTPSMDGTCIPFWFTS